MANQMQVQDFIKKSLSDILEGVRGSMEIAKRHGAEINPPVHMPGDLPLTQTGTSRSRQIESVHFDIAVTVTEGSEATAGIGVVAGIIGVGTRGTTGLENSSVSRVRFSIPISWPHHND